MIIGSDADIRAEVQRYAKDCVLINVQRRHAGQRANSWPEPCCWSVVAAADNNDRAFLLDVLTDRTDTIMTFRQKLGDAVSAVKQSVYGQLATGVYVMSCPVVAVQNVGIVTAIDLIAIDHGPSWRPIDGAQVVPQRRQRVAR